MTTQEALQKIKELEEFIKNEEKKPTKEQRFIEIANNLVQKFDPEKCPNSVFYFRGDDLIFEIVKNSIWCSYEYVWSIFEKEFSMEYSEIQSFINNQIEQHFKRKGLTPR